MAEYEVAIVHAFADRLMLRASLLVWLSTLVGAALGLSLGLMASRLVLQQGFAVVVVAGAAGCVVGGQVGCWRAGALREQAQTALCLMEIARNPRREYE